MESDDKTAKETTLGRLIKPLLECTMYTTPRPFSHIYLMSIKQALWANKLNMHTHTDIIIKSFRNKSKEERSHWSDHSSPSWNEKVTYSVFASAFPTASMPHPLSSLILTLIAWSSLSSCSHLMHERCHPSPTPSLSHISHPSQSW